MGIAVLLILVLFCGYADEAAAIPEGDPAEAEASEEDEGFGGEDIYEPQENGAEEEIIDYALPEVVPEGIGVDGGVPDGVGLDGSDN